VLLTHPRRCGLYALHASVAAYLRSFRDAAVAAEAAVAAPPVGLACQTICIMVAVISGRAYWRRRRLDKPLGRANVLYVA